MVKRRLTAFRTFLLPFLLVPTIWVTAKDREERKKQKMEQAISALPDTAYASVRKEDLLNDEVYIKLARDGWNAQEISRIMNRYLKQNRSRVRGSFEYGMYAKQWLPTYGHTPGSDTIYQFVDTTYNETAIKSARRLFSRELAAYYEPIPYTPDDRMSGIRNTGYFRPVLQKPNTGRIHWIVVHPTDPDALMVVPDGAGIFQPVRPAQDHLFADACPHDVGQVVGVAAGEESLPVGQFSGKIAVRHVMPLSFRR